MRPLAVAAVAALLAASVMACGCVRRVDDGFIIETKHGVVDPIGEVRLAFTRATRNCTAVQRLTEYEMAAMLSKSKFEKPTAAKTIRTRGGWKQDDWALVEADFDNAEPAILLLHLAAEVNNVVSVYGGTAAPFNDVQVIHSYFLHASASAPSQLVNCYEPLGPPFNRAS